jgi:hypothetical protein
MEQLSNVNSLKEALGMRDEKRAAAAVVAQS